MKRYAAHYVFSPNSGLIKNGFVTVSDKGEFSEIEQLKEDARELDRMEFHNGILLVAEDISLEILLNNAIKDADLEMQLKNALEGQKATNLFLLSGLDLINLKLTNKTKLKKLV